MGATLSLAYRGSLDPDHILHDLLSGSSDTRQVRLRFVPGARNLLDNLARLGIRASEWTNHKWKTEYCENVSRLRAFVPETGARPVGMDLPRAAWVKLNRLRTGIGRFHSSMHKWGLAPSPNCKCGASKQTADHVLTACPIHQAPYGARGLTVLDDETRCWLLIHGSAAVWGSKRINPRPQSCLCLTWSGYTLQATTTTTTFTCCTSFPALSLCLANLYNSFLLSFVFNLAYKSSYARPFAIATAFFALFFFSLYCRSF